ncbi:hypothetical protein [Asticcacaulis sp. AND118]|uniref:hypothetical protein n=1 Tax=Asticcacaulis sp. AND118 TaxID=2840468 RepID=UPI001CFFDAAE|nr:hypothetical protein [Asticcacaulis sp. AND118]UDF03814.1 hypothetical protein LH365_01865 [Asticcacaulis sp. AND118]
MTNISIFTPFLSPFDLATAYVSSFGAAAVLSRQATLMAHRESLSREISLTRAQPQPHPETLS